MEQWVPLFEIFLHSPAPEGEASQWLQNHHHRPPNATAAAAFLSLLLTPTPVLKLRPASSSPALHTPIWIRTLPYTIQSHILSFLAAEHRRFCRRRLRSLATHVLNSGVPASPDQPGFWVHQAARNLFDAVSSSDPFPALPLREEEIPGRDHLEEGNPGRNQLETQEKEDLYALPQWLREEEYPKRDQLETEEKEDFYALPQWLLSPACAATPLLPWLPLSRLPDKRRRSLWVSLEKHKKMEMDLDTKREEEEAEQNSECGSSYAPPPPLDPQVCHRASALKAEVLASDSTMEALRLAHEIRQLCLESGDRNQLTILGLIEPWEADDETASVFLSHLSGEESLAFGGWPAHVLCSVVLPKLLILRSPASRLLLSATIGFCRLHPTAAVEALLIPLALCKEGVTVVLCDVLTRIIKECLHPSHVSAFCQRLLCSKGKDLRPVCLPCHQQLIADELVWTDPLFTLFQHILNRDVPLTPDTAGQLVSVIGVTASKFSRSLKFGNFMLSFVTKCPQASSTHKLLLERAAEKTDTFMTKSILMKLGGL